MEQLTEANINLIITALAALFSSIVGALAGGLTTYIVQSKLARKARNSDRSAIAAMFIADIRNVNEWLERTNMTDGLEMLRDRLKAPDADGSVGSQITSLFRLISANLKEIDEAIYQRQSLAAGSLGLLAVDVAAFYSSLASLKSNLAGFIDGLYDGFPIEVKLDILTTVQAEIAVLAETQKSTEPRLLALIT